MKHEWFPVTLSFVLTYPSDRFNLSVCLSVSNSLKCNFNREAEMFIPRGPVAGSFQHTLWPRRRASDATILESRAFAFVFIGYKVIIALSLCLSSGALQHTVHTSIIVAEIVSVKCFLRALRFRSGLEARSNEKSNTKPISTKYRLQTG